MTRIRARWATRLAVVGVAAAAIIGSGQIPAHASLGSVGVVLSNNQVSATATYTATFTTGVALVTDLVMMVPSGVTGTPILIVKTASTCTGTFATISDTVTYSGTTAGVTIPTGSALSLGTCVQMTVTGLTNPSSTGSSYVCLGDGTLTSVTLTGLTCGSSGITGAITSQVLDTIGAVVTYVSQVVNGTTTNLSLAPVLTVLVNGSAGGALQSASVTPAATGVTSGAPTDAVNVATNAATYTIEGQIQGTVSDLSRMGGAGSGSDLIPLTWTTGSCPSAVPFATSAGGTYSTVSSGLAGLTNAATTSVKYCWSIDLTHPVGTYTATVNYLVVPSF